MIIGEDLMTELGIILNYNKQSITWDGITRPMRNLNASEGTLQQVQEENRHSEALKESLRAQEVGLDITSVLINIKSAIKKSKHLTRLERKKLKRLLTKYKEIFNGTLGKISGGEYHINIKDDTPRSLQK